MTTGSLGWKRTVIWPVVLVLGSVVASDAVAQGGGGGGGGGGRPSGESFGNNLSYPVIWSEGVPKVLRGTPGMVPLLDGTWWYWWGVDAASGSPLSCAPDPDDLARCDDGQVGSVGSAPGDGAVRVFLQKDEFNVWQAGSIVPPAGEFVIVDKIDWGDNLESVNWTIRSQVRTEVVLIEELDAPDPILPPGWEPYAPMLEYGMRHVSGWGINEVHGVAAPFGAAEIVDTNATATVYSHCARLVIQRLNIDREDPLVARLVWTGADGWQDPAGEGLINAPIYDGKVWEGGDGPGYYSAEINVKGKVIYGYTWNVRQNNEGVGDYRITFSLEPGTPNDLKTYFVEGVTSILEVVEEGESLVESGEEDGARGVVDFANNLTYIDTRIVGKTGGGGKKPTKK